MKLSVIIPVYNAVGTICRSLDSIYAQGLDPREFEVICVDDCSTDTSVDVLNRYLYEGVHPDNLKVIRHPVNTRQGGGRNTGIRAAEGKWILHLDNDDFFVEGSLKKLLEVAESDPSLDTVMFDSCIGDGTQPCATSSYIPLHLDTQTMTGVEFLQRIPVPWCPWSYLYRRDHLLSTGLFFAEHVRFEDSDFVLKYTARSLAIRFLPLVVYYHTIHPGQTSSVDNDPERIKDAMRIGYRVFDAAIKEKPHSPAASKAIMGHAAYMWRSCLKSYVWRLPSYKDIKAMLSECRYTEPTGDRLVDFANRHITPVALVLTAGGPFLHVAARAKKHLRRR